VNGALGESAGGNGALGEVIFGHLVARTRKSAGVTGDDDDQRQEAEDCSG
jgi:hypothetical protein